MIRITAALASAEVDLHSNKWAEGARNLAVLLTEINRAGYILLAFQTRLLLAEGEIQSGKFAAAHAHLEQLQSEARSKSFLLIARQTSALLPSAIR